MKPLDLPKKDRSTLHLTKEFLDEVRSQVEGLEHGTLGIVVKGGYIIGFEFRQWRPYRSRSEGLEKEKD